MKHTTDYTLNVNGRLMSLSEPKVMGILNATPDSFFAGSRQQSEAQIEARAAQIIAEGGAIIDVGAYSTRPGAQPVAADEEMRRMRMALRAVRRVQPDAVLSVDTFRPAVAQMAVEEYGAAIINDVSGGNTDGVFGGTDANMGHLAAGQTADYPEMFRLVARLGVPYVLMSACPDVLTTMKWFAAKVQQLRDLGAKDILLDPGFGFGKTVEQNYRLMAELPKLHEIGLPLLVGVSRKSMICRMLGITADDSLNATTALNTVAMLHGGASVLRVHDVRECAEAVRIVSQCADYQQ